MMASVVAEEIDRTEHMSDERLARAAALGDRRAFDAIVTRHGPALYRYAVNMLSDHGAAEEAVQDAFVAAWKGLDNFRSDAKLRTWLFGITAHKAIDTRRRRVPRPAEDWVFDAAVADATTDPQVQASGSDFLKDLHAALTTLPERQRACWLLREVEGMTHVEIGRIVSLTPGAVRGHVTRARATLAERMSSWR